MNSRAIAGQGHRLVQIGVALFLFTSIQGFVVPYFAVPALGRSVHTRSGFGPMWSMLHLGVTASRIAFWFFIYSIFATIAGFVIAGILGAGSSIIPIAADGARGSNFMYSAAPTGITSFALILWGLRCRPDSASETTL